MGGDEVESESDDEDYDDARENQQHKRTSSISESLLGGIASLNPSAGRLRLGLLGGGVGSVAADQPRRSTATPEAPLNDVQREKLERHRALLRDLLGDDFVVTDPVMELQVHATSIHVGALDVEIGGTSALGSTT